MLHVSLCMPPLCVDLNFLIKVHAHLEHNSEADSSLILRIESGIRDGDLGGGSMPFVRKSTAVTLTVIVQRGGVRREGDVEDCAALSVRVGGLSVKIAAGISAVTSTIGYAHQMENIVSSA